MSTLQERIVEVLRMGQLSVAELARIAGVSSSAVSQWISGDTKKIKAEAAAKIEDKLGIRSAWLVTGKGPRHLLDARQDLRETDGELLPLRDGEPELVVAFRLLRPEYQEEVLAHVRQLVQATHERTAQIMQRLGVDKRADDERVSEKLPPAPRAPQPSHEGAGWAARLCSAASGSMIPRMWPRRRRRGARHEAARPLHPGA